VNKKRINFLKKKIEERKQELLSLHKNFEKIGEKKEESCFVMKKYYDQIVDIIRRPQLIKIASNEEGNMFCSNHDKTLNQEYLNKLVNKTLFDLPSETIILYEEREEILQYKGQHSSDYIRKNTQIEENNSEIK
jgi:hypothetical protein